MVPKVPGFWPINEVLKTRHGPVEWVDFFASTEGWLPAQNLGLGLILSWWSRVVIFDITCSMFQMMVGQRNHLNPPKSPNRSNRTWPFGLVNKDSSAGNLSFAIDQWIFEDVVIHIVIVRCALGQRRRSLGPKKHHAERNSVAVSLDPHWVGLRET